MTLTTVELLELFYQRFDSFQVLWTIYSTVVLGIVATLVSFPKHLNSKTARILFIIGFIAFSIANVGALLGVQEERINLLFEINKREGCPNSKVTLNFHDYFSNSFTKTTSKINGIKSITCEKPLQSKALIKYFHLFQDFLVLMLIWILPVKLAHFQFFRSISKSEIRIRNSQLPNPIISWDQTNRIWVLEESVEVEVHLMNQTEPFKLMIPEQFRFDLATIPRLFWTLIAPFELSIIAPLVHDYIYVQKGLFFIADSNKIVDRPSSKKLYVSRLECDKIFLRQMELEGIGKLKRNLCYFGVRWFGGWFWKENNSKS